MVKDKQKESTPVALAQVSHIFCQCHPGGLISSVLQMLPHSTSNRGETTKTRTSNLKLFFILITGKKPFPHEIGEKIQTDCAFCSLLSSSILSSLILLLPPTLCLFPSIRSNTPSPRDKYSFSTFNSLDLILPFSLLELLEFMMIPLKSLPQMLLGFKQTQCFLTDFRGINHCSCHLG